MMHTGDQYEIRARAHRQQEIAALARLVLLVLGRRRKPVVAVQTEPSCANDTQRPRERAA